MDHATEVYDSDMLANMIPGITAAGSTSTARGESTSPQALMTTRMYAVEMRARVAPHRISPVITSSMLTGVATIASNVRWFSIRKKEPQPHSAEADHIGQTARSPGAMKSQSRCHV